MSALETLAVSRVALDEAQYWIQRLGVIADQENYNTMEMVDDFDFSDKISDAGMMWRTSRELDTLWYQFQNVYQDLAEALKGDGTYV